MKQVLPKADNQTEVYLIRHAVTSNNKSGKFQGSSDIPIDEEGWEQAEILKERLLRERIKPDKIFVSKLSRTQQTIAPFANELKMEFEVLEGIEEINGGKLEGVYMPDLLKDYAEEIELSHTFPYRVNMPGGESGQNAYERVVAAFKRVVSEYKSQTVLLVSHGYVLQLLIGFLKGIKPEDIPANICRNTAITRVLVDQDGKINIDYEMDSSHLD